MSRGFQVSTVSSPPACCAVVNKPDRNFKDNLLLSAIKGGLRRSDAMKDIPVGRIGRSPLIAKQNGGGEFLAGATFKDRLRVAGLLAAGAGSFVRRGLGVPLYALMGLGRRPPERLLDRPARYTNQRSHPRGGHLCRLFCVRRQDRQCAWPLAVRTCSRSRRRGRGRSRDLAGSVICAPPIPRWRAPMPVPLSMIF